MRVVHVVAALQAPGTPEELRGADAAYAALLAGLTTAETEADVVVPLVPRGSTRTGLVVGSVVALTVAFAGTAAAAATGSLPAPLQRVAAALVGAPAPVEDAEQHAPTAPIRSSLEPSGTPSPPRATPGADSSGPAAPSPAATSPAAGPAASSHGAAPSTPPGQTRRPTTPPGQNVRPSVPPGQSGRPTSPPGQTKRPSTPPGQSGKPATPHS